MATILPLYPPIQTVEAEFADGKRFKVSTYRTQRTTGRRIIAHADGKILFDTGDQYDWGNAASVLALWIDSVGGTKIP